MCLCICKFKCEYKCTCMNASVCAVREKVDPRVAVEWFCEFIDFGAEYEQVNDGTRKMSSRMR